MSTRSTRRTTRSSNADEPPAVSESRLSKTKMKETASRASVGRRRTRTVETADSDDEVRTTTTHEDVLSSPGSLSLSNQATPMASSPAPTISESHQRGSIREEMHRLTLMSPGIENKSPQIATPKTASRSPALKSSLLRDITPSRQNISVVGLDPIIDKPLDKATEKIPTPKLEGPKARLVISNLVLENFKSYAGRQEIGPFHSSFSAIVGPNGSGKSNVIDSLLFVFGFRASKMRQAKISALIHNSIQYPDLASCSVEVHFHDVIDNPDGTSDVVPGSKMVVCRRAYKNNASKYLINERESNYGEVTSLLKERGIDLDHKRFLILQGEVESIAQMKPKAQTDNDDGLLEYLEDIIGTAKYKKLIEDSAQELDLLNEVCREKSARLDIVQKEKSSLEDKRNTVLKYINDENELTMKKSALYQIYVANCLQSIAVTEGILRDLSAQLQEESKSNTGNVKEIESLNNQYKESIEQLENLKAESKAVAKAFAKHERDLVQLNERKKHAASKQEKLTKLIASSKLSVNSSSAWMTNYEEEVGRLQSEIAQLQKNLHAEESVLEDIRESLAGKTKGFSEEIEKKQKLLEPWYQQINAKVSQLDVAKSELRIMCDKQASDEKAIHEQEQTIETVIANGRAKESELEKLKVEHRRIVEQIELGEVEVREALEALNVFKDRVSMVRQKTEESRQQFNTTQSQGKVLTSLMRLTDSGRINGFFGRLGNLGVIDERFDIAISTACPALNNLVVENVETGQACIEYLRKHDLGRAMFILLDKLPVRDLSAIQTPENVPRLFDLVKPKDPRFAQAFYSVLHDTLVAKDMAQANRIAFAKKRWRVVTLDGKLIDASGTMSGGGSKVSKGLMRNKLVQDTSEATVAKMEEEYAAAEKQLEIEQAKVTAMEAALKNLVKQRPKTELAISKIELEIQALGSHLIDSRKMLTDLKSELSTNSANDKAVKGLQKQISSIESDIQKLKDRVFPIEQEIKELEEQIMQVGGVKLRIQKSKVDGILQQIELRNEQISNAEMSKKKTEKDTIKQNNAVTSAEQELVAVEKELKSVAKDLLAVQNAADELEAASNKAVFMVEEHQEKLNEMKEKVDERMKDINAFKKAELEIRNKIESNEKEIKENKSRLRHWSEKLLALSLHDSGDENPCELSVYSDDELNDMDEDELKAEIAHLEDKNDKVQVDLTVLDEYRRRESEYQTRNADLQESASSRDAIKQRYEDLRKRRLDEFMAGFSQISIKLKEMYQMITMGGNAELELVDSLDPFSEGILFSVMPPKKSWKNISNLSGGEKTLSSLALVFALHHFKPTPLYVMDEIDAALDFRNVSIVANYIKERTKNAQFIVISLRNNMFELATQLVGIYKVNHMTKSITIQNRELEAQGRHNQS